MARCIIAEYIKLKHTFTKKLVLLAPTIVILLCLVLMYGGSFVNGSYNWWYFTILPGTLTLICTGIIQKDIKKVNYRAVLGLPFKPSAVWTGKIGISVCLLSISCAIVYTFATIGSFIFGSTISTTQSAEASILIFLTFIWQIPLCMFLSDRFGTYITFFINFACNIVFAVSAAKSSLWWAVPYAIPSRLMCSVIKVLPNGLPVPANDPLLNSNVVFPGVVISLILFFMLSVLTTMWFEKREAK